jgi:hypothetical protein
MVPRKSGWLFIACILWLLHGGTPSLFSQTIGYQIDGDRRRIEIPFDNLNNLIIIPVRINGILPSRFILDSGVALTILTEKAICDYMKIPCERRLSLPVIGAKDSVAACISTMVRLDLPGVESLGQNMVVLEEDYLNLTSYLGENVQGIIGYDLFRNFVIRVDYINKVITLIQPGRFKPPHSYDKIPLRVIGNRPYIPVTVYPKEGEPVIVNLLLDLGASHAVMFEIDSTQLVKIPPNHIETIVGRGLGGDITGYMGRINHLQLGSYKLHDVIVSFSDAYGDQEKNPLNRQGAIGGEILSRFYVIVDYAGGALYLKRNFTYARPFEFNLSGLEIMATGIELNQFEVVRVQSDSPAGRAGIQQGDRIMVLNGKDANEMTLNEINHMMRTKPGKKIWLKVERDGKWIKYTFRLERSI